MLYIYNSLGRLLRKFDCLDFQSVCCKLDCIQGHLGWVAKFFYDDSDSISFVFHDGYWSN